MEKFLHEWVMHLLPLLVPHVPPQVKVKQHWPPGQALPPLH
jgi:hypothetical protein